jgi:hypothetical protein
MSKRLLAWAAVAALAVVVGRGASLAEDAPSLDGSKLGPGPFEGSLVSLPDSNRMFTLGISVPHVEANGALPAASNLQRQIAKVEKLRQQLLANPSPSNLLSYQRAAVQLQAVAAAVPNAVKVVNVPLNVDFQAREDVKVRTRTAPVGFDDKGNIRRYTPAEQREMKGKNPNMVGYEATIDALKAGQKVMVYLSPKGAALVTKVGADKGKPEQPPEKPAEKPRAGVEKDKQVYLIVIAGDPTGESAPRVGGRLAPRKAGAPDINKVDK